MTNALSKRVKHADRLNSKDQNRLRQRRGEGFGMEYQPWLQVHEVHSEGVSVRTLGLTVPREYHLLSWTLEAGAFEIFDMSDRVRDIREQLPLLNLERYLDLAETLGIKPLMVPGTHELVMPTSDLHVQEQVGGEETHTIYECKPASKLRDERVLEKFELQRRYWQGSTINGLFVHWFIVTEHEIPSAFVENMRQLRPYRTDEPTSQLSQVEFHNNRKHLEASWSPELPLLRIARSVDVQLKQRRGTALDVAFTLLSRKIWRVNLLELVSPELPLPNVSGFLDLC